MTPIILDHDAAASLANPRAVVVGALVRNLKASLASHRRASAESPYRVIVAYSGGLDSTVLLTTLRALSSPEMAPTDALREEIAKWDSIGPMDVVAAWCDHGWRGAPAPELPRLHKTCQQLRVPLFCMHLPQRKLQQEGVARSDRYRALLQLADSLKADMIVTAHHQQDQVETILLHVLRGSGIAGLAGVDMVQKFDVRAFGGVNHLAIPVLRPLIDVPRSVLKAFQETEGLYFYEDPSNTSTTHRRNKVRHDILPALKESFPQLERNLLLAAHWTREDLRWLEGMAQEHLDVLLHRGKQLAPAAAAWETTYGALPIEGLRALAKPLQRRILQRFAQQALGLHPPLSALSRVCDFIAQETLGRANPKFTPLGALPNGKVAYLALQYGFCGLTFNATPAALNRTIFPNEDQCLTLEPPGVFFHAGMKHLLTIREASNSERKRFHPSQLDPKAMEVVVNLDWLLNAEEEWTFTLRPRRTGDRFMPLGMPTTVSLKRYLINQKVPREQRDTLPLLVAGEDQVLWVPGVGVSETLRIFDKPTHVFKLEPANEPPPPPRRLRYQIEEEERAANEALLAAGGLGRDDEGPPSLLSDDDDSRLVLKTEMDTPLDRPRRSPDEDREALALDTFEDEEDPIEAP